MSERNYWTSLRHRKISRRTMLQASGRAGVGAAGLALVGCGGDDDDDDAPAAAATEQAEEQAQATEQAQTEEQAQAQAEEQAEQAEPAEEQAVAGAPVLGGKIVRTSAFDIDQGWNPSRVTSGADTLGFLQFI